VIVLIVIAGSASYYWYFMRPPPAPAEPIKIGFEAPLTGPMAWDGTYMLYGAKVAEAIINERGGVLGRPIKIIAEDDESKPEKGAAAVEKLITKDGVVGVVGCLHSSVAFAIIEKAIKKYGCPFVITNAWRDDLTVMAHETPGIFRVTTYVGYNLGFYADFIKSTGAKNIVCYSYADDYAISMQEGIIGKLKETGIEVKANMYHDVFATDFTADLTKIKSDVPKADLLYTATLGTGAAVMLKQAREMGLNALHVFSWTGILLSADWWEVLGDYGDYAVDLNCYLPGKELTDLGKEVSKKHLEMFGIPCTGVGIVQFDGVLALCAGIEKAKSTKYEDIIKGMEAIDVEGASMKRIKFMMEPTGPLYHQVKPPLFFWQYQKRKMVIVYPQDVAEAKFVWPPGNPNA